MTWACVICGTEHREVVGDDAIIPYLTTAKHYIFEKLLKASEFRNHPSPICRHCGNEFKKFMHHRGALLAAEFLQHIAAGQARSIAVRLGLERARESGKRLGRPPTITDAQRKRAIELRGRGLSYKKICAETGMGQGTLQAILKKGVLFEVEHG